MAGSVVLAKMCMHRNAETAVIIRYSLKFPNSITVEGQSFQDTPFIRAFRSINRVWCWFIILHSNRKSDSLVDFILSVKYSHSIYAECDAILYIRVYLRTIYISIFFVSVAVLFM